jgi:hypothetical protein
MSNLRALFPNLIKNPRHGLAASAQNAMNIGHEICTDTPVQDIRNTQNNINIRSCLLRNLALFTGVAHIKTSRTEHHCFYLHPQDHIFSRSVREPAHEEVRVSKNTRRKMHGCVLARSTQNHCFRQAWSCWYFQTYFPKISYSFRIGKALANGETRASKWISGHIVFVFWWTLLKTIRSTDMERSVLLIT